MKFKPNPFHSQVHLSEKMRNNNRSYTVRSNRDRYFFPDEWMAFFDELTTNQKLTFQFLINTGARINEVKHVMVEDIDLDRSNIVFRWTKSRNKDGTRRIRTIPISTQFRDTLRRLMAKKGLKQGMTFKILSTPGANIAMKKTLRWVEMPDWRMFSVHNIRKTTEMWLMALGIDMMKVSKHMGHSIAIAAKHYVSPEIFSFDDREKMRQVLGDLYQH